MFFILNNGLCDASIAVWYVKRLYDSVRPISAIRFLFNKDWNSYIPTPPFGSYVSGHSTFSSAAAEILKLFTKSDNYGDSVIIKAKTLQFDKEAPTKDVRLYWCTFTDAANEAGMSRLYGGIHFMDDNTEGKKMGRRIGTIAYKKGLSFIRGKP